MKKALHAALLLAMPAILAVCSADNPTTSPVINPVFAPVNSALPTLTATASRFDLAADGVDAVVITATARNSNGTPAAGQQILWTISGRNFTGSVGSVSSAVSVTDANGIASTAYQAPDLSFVPVGASVTVRGTLSVPNNPEGSPRASVTFILRPEGSAPDTDPTTGQPVPPVITSVTPNSIKVDANPAITVLVQGTGFAETSQILIITAEALVSITPTFFSSTQLRFTPTAELNSAGSATMFVTAPGDQLSEGFPVTLTTGVTVIDDPPASPVISSILPSQIPVQTSTTMVILGSGFNVQSCPSSGNISFINEFIGLQRLCPTEASATRLVVNSPVFGTTEAGTVNVFVQNDDGSTSNTVQVTVLPSNTNAPVITSMSPGSGPTTGGTRVLIAGLNFAADHSVIITGPNVFSPATDTCADGQPFCSNNQCVLDASRGLCTINGTPGVDPFTFGGSGQIEIVTPSVGTSSAGPVDVIIRTPTGVPSNVFTWNYASPASILKPRLDALSVTQVAGRSPTVFNFTGYAQIVRGANFRKCSSLIFASVSDIYEILPTPDVADCAIRRGSTATESPAERIRRILPPDGMTINCLQRPDLIPLDCTGSSSPTQICSTRLYRHGQVCSFSTATASPFAPFDAAMISSPTEVNDVTSGGAATWINESEIRLLYGPPEFVACENTDTVQVYVSNDPGRGLSGDFLSDPIAITFSNPEECGGGTPVIGSLSQTTGSCDGGYNVVINGSNLAGATVLFGGALPTIVSNTSSQIVVTLPGGATPPFGESAGCLTYAGTNMECTVTITVSTAGGSATTSFIFTSTTATGCN